MVQQKNKKILFHSTNGVGLGHLTRTLNVANSIRKLDSNINIAFVTNSNSTHLIEAKKYPFLKFKYHEGKRLVDEDLPKFMKYIDDFKPDILLHDTNFHKKVLDYSCCKRIKNVLILRKLSEDNLASFLLSNSFEKFELVLIPHTKEEFQEYNNYYLDLLFNSKKIKFVGSIVKPFYYNPEIKKDNKKFNILVTCGGGGKDKNNLDADNFLNMIRQCSLKLGEGRNNINITIVTGPYYQKELKILYSKVIKYEKELLSLMNNSDLLISAAGYNICNELVLTKTPAILVPFRRYNESQLERAKRLERKGVAKVLTDFDSEKLTETILDLYNNADKLEQMKKNFDNIKLNIGNKIAAKEIIKLLDKSNSQTIFNLRRRIESTRKKNLFKNRIPRNFNLNIKSVAYLHSCFLFSSESFIFNEIMGLKKYKPLVLTFRKRISQFPDIVPTLIIKQLNQPIKETFKENKVSVIHGQYGDHTLEFLDLIRESNLPLVVSFRGLDIYKDANRGIYSGLFKEASLFLVRSGIMQNDLINLGCNPKKVIVHRTGIDLDQFQFKKRKIRDKIKFLSVGRFVEKKGTIYLLKAFHKLLAVNKNIQLTLIGDGIESNNEIVKKEILDYISKKNLEKNVQIKKLIPFDKMNIEYSNHDIFVHPSITAKNGDKEGIPNSLKEAMASGMPVISTFHSGIPELIENNVNGFLVEEKNIDELFKKMKFVLDNYSEMDEICIRARKKIEKDYDLVKQTEKLEKIYDLVVDNSLDIQDFEPNSINNALTYCHYLWDSVYIDEKGNVFICCHSMPEEIGNIYEKNLREIWLENEKLEKLRNESLNDHLECFNDCNLLSKKDKQNETCYLPYKKHPRRIEIQFGCKCNINCVMCGQDHKSDITLDINVLKNNIDWDFIEIIKLQGGEILAMQNAKEFFLWLTQKKNKKVGLITNGVLIDDEWIEHLVKGSDYIEISVNAATKNTHNMINSGSNFERVINNIKKLVYLKNKLSLDTKIIYKMTLVKKNLHELINAILFADSIGCDYIRFGYDVQIPNYLNQNPSLKKKIKSKLFSIMKENLKIKIDRKRLEYLDLL